MNAKKKYLHRIGLQEHSDKFKSNFIFQKYSNHCLSTHFCYVLLLSFAALTTNLNKSANSCFLFSLLESVVADWLSLAVFKDDNSMLTYLLTP